MASFSRSLPADAHALRIKALSQLAWVPPFALDMERSKQLSPAFLGEAMELSEEADAAAQDAAATASLRARVRAQVDARLTGVLAHAAWVAPDTRQLATSLHELRVLRRVLRDLGSPA